MNIDLWTIRTSAQYHLRAWALAAVVLALAALATAQPVHPTSENGRVVWTNDDTAAPVVGAPTHTSKTRSSMQLFYWSSVEKRWKPVRPASPSAMRSAEVVASEVSSYITSRPRLDSTTLPVKGRPAALDPNYSQVAGNRSVSAAQIDRYINDAAARHHVDPNLVRALVKVESNFNPGAVSRKGAMGLMQLMPATARMYDLRNPFDAAQNLDAGVRHLKDLLDNFRGNVPLSLAAYNAGQGAVERNAGIPPYTETRNYVKRITNLMGDGSQVSVYGSPARNLSMPIHVSRDDRGRLVVSNVE
jgi:soluble lytic murein transglycosylase-like protein